MLARDNMWVLIERALDLGSAFVDFLRTSPASVSLLQLAGIVLVAFLLGLLIGRITKRGVQRAVEPADEPEAGRVSLDFGRLTPLGPSEEEEAEKSAMDISDLRSDRLEEERTDGARKEPQKPTILKE